LTFRPRDPPLPDWLIKKQKQKERRRREREDIMLIQDNNNNDEEEEADHIMVVQNNNNYDEEDLCPCCGEPLVDVDPYQLIVPTLTMIAISFDNTPHHRGRGRGRNNRRGRGRNNRRGGGRNDRGRRGGRNSSHINHDLYPNLDYSPLYVVEEVNDRRGRGGRNSSHINYDQNRQSSYSQSSPSFVEELDDRMESLNLDDEEEFPSLPSPSSKKSNNNHHNQKKKNSNNRQNQKRGGRGKGRKKNKWVKKNE